jgi:phosphoenolpyruvate synthase/pyruvate phosphate dikinase
MVEQRWVIPFEHLRMRDVDQVGGKNASLGEMLSQLGGAGIRVPGGFATTAFAFREFLDRNGLARRIAQRVEKLDVDDIAALTSAGADIRRWIVEAPLPAPLNAAIEQAFIVLTREAPNATFAVRSSATAEDLPDASFAGQQGDIPEYQWLGEHTSCCKGGIFFALQRPRDLLSRAPGLCPWRCRVVSRRATNGAG